MSGSIAKTSPSEALRFTRLNEPGRYEVQFPVALAFGVVTIGGLVLSSVHTVAVDFISTSASHSHHDLWNMAVSFFRPTLSAPRKAIVTIRMASSTKTTSALHVQVEQDGKLCVAGYLILTNFARPGVLSVQTRWKLSPQPKAITLEQLESDQDPNWISYLTPFKATSYRRPQAYIKYYLPINRTSINVSDHWVTPAWQDKDFPNGPVWTNELLHFLIDNNIPTLNDIINQDQGDTLHTNIIRAGLEQRQACLEGRADKEILGKGLSDADLDSFIVSTAAISTEVKRILPKEGTKWLFLRVTTRSLIEDRMDFDIVVLDLNGDLVATSHHTMQVIPVAAKKAKDKRPSVL